MGVELVCRLVVPILVLLAAGPAVFTGSAPPRADRPGASVCGEADRTLAEHRFVVSGRVRPLGFWMGRRDVGHATIAESAGRAGVHRLTLLVGTDPARAPFGVNRWGYVRETTCPAGADVVGVMTEADEEGVAEARARAEGRAGDVAVYRGVQSLVSGATTRARLTDFVSDASLTYQDLAEVLRLLPPTPVDEAPRDVAPGVAPGFLHAVAAILEALEPGLTPDRATRTQYLHGDLAFGLRVKRQSTTRPRSGGARDGTTALEVEFETTHPTTHRRTTFSLQFARDQDARVVPLRVVFRPRWWLELELRPAD